MRTFLPMITLLAFANPLAAAVTATYTGNTLRIETTSGDSVAVTVVSGNVKINGADPSTGALAVGDCPYIDVFGDSLGNSIILSPVTVANGFPENGRARIYGQGGNDSVTGTEWGDQIFPGPGVDTVEAGPGDDYVFCKMGDGGDSLNGNQGNDTVRIDGFDTAEDLLVENSGGNVLLTDRVAGIDMPSIEGFTELSLFLMDGDDQAEIRDLAGTDVLRVLFDGTVGNDTCDASANSVQTIFTCFYGEGSDEFAGSTNGNDWVNIGGRTNDSPTNYVCSQQGGQTVVSIDNPVNQIKFSAVENLYMNGDTANDTYTIPLLTGTDLKDISFWGAGGDDSADVVASPDYSIDMSGGDDTAGDTLTIDADGQSYSEGSSFVLVNGRMRIDHYEVENLSVINSAKPGDVWHIR